MLRPSWSGNTSRYKGYCLRNPENIKEMASVTRMQKTSKVWNQDLGKILYTLDPKEKSHLSKLCNKPLLGRMIIVFSFKAKPKKSYP